MKKKFKELTVNEIKKIKIGELKKITNIIIKENNYSILSKLNKSIIKEYLSIAINSKVIFLFVLRKNKKIIGYSLFAKKTNYLINEFKTLKFKIFTNLFIKLKLISIINIILALTKIDLILIKKKKIEDITNSLNLNLLAIENRYHSKGYGYFFLNKTLKLIYKNFFKFKLVSCEAPNLRAFDFYLKKCRFEYVGKKIRFGRSLFILKREYK